MATSASAASKGQKPPDKIPTGKKRKDGNATAASQAQPRRDTAPVYFEEKVYLGASNDALKKVVSGNQDQKGAAVKAPPPNAPVTLPSAVRSCWPDLFPTMSSAKKSIRKGIFFVRQKTATKGKCDTQVAVGDTIVRKLPNQESHFRTRGPSTEEIIDRALGGKLRIAYLDEQVAVVIKPHGMPVHKVHGNDIKDEDDGGDTALDKTNARQRSKLVSMHELLLHCLPTPNNGVDVLRRPAAIHRLDQPTYGLLVVARTRPSARFLSKAFEERTLYKRYRALVHGHVDGEINDKAPTKGTGTLVNLPIGGKECTSEYFIVQKLVVHGGAVLTVPAEKPDSNKTTTTQPILLTLVDLVLHTGRKHQLRKHMASLGHPIVGDTRYGKANDDHDLSKALVASSSTPTNAANKDQKPSAKPKPCILYLALAAVEITFPHRRRAIPSGTAKDGTNPSTTNSANNNDEVKNLKSSVMANIAKHSFDITKGTLNVAIDMPESMRNILRMSENVPSRENKEEIVWPPKVDFELFF